EAQTMVLRTARRAPPSILQNPALAHGISRADSVKPPANHMEKRDVSAIGIIGSAGRMGRALAAAVPDLGATLAGGIDAGGDPVDLAHAADVLIDFSSPSAL